MRKMKVNQLLTFLILLVLIVGTSICSARWLTSKVALGSYEPIAVVIGSVVLIYVGALLVYQVLLRFFRLPEGEIAPDSPEEFRYFIYLLFNMFLFHPLVSSGVIPIPLLRLLYQALGGRFGENTFGAGLILDPQFVTIGSNTIIGQGSMLIPHVIEGAQLAHYPIQIGSNVTIGANSVVLSGVTVGDNAVIAIGAVVSKNTTIGAGETWGGIPARRL